jgi:multidrug transporter EmrE-like cation transporter
MEQVTKYFDAEKFESIFFISAGIIAIILAFYLIFVLKKPFQNGIAYSIAAIALIQIVVGTSVFFRSPKDIVRVNHLIQTDLKKILSEEIPRMEVVMKNFALYKYIEIGLIVAGIGLLVLSRNEIINGVGLGLAIQSSIMLLLDYIAAGRGDVYLKFLQSL